MTDEELIAFLEARFRETSRQIAESRAETSQQVGGLREELASFRDETIGRFEQVDRRFEQVDRRFEQVDGRFEQMDRRFEQVDGRFEQVDRRFEQVEQVARHTLVLVEDLRDQVHILAEGYISFNERLERYQSDATVTFEQVKGWMEPYYEGLNRRVSILEGRSDRLQGNVMDAMRKLLGKPIDET